MPCAPGSVKEAYMLSRGKKEYPRTGCHSWKISRDIFSPIFWKISLFAEGRGLVFLCLLLLYLYIYIVAVVVGAVETVEILVCFALQSIKNRSEVEHSGPCCRKTLRETGQTTRKQKTVEILVCLSITFLYA